MRFVQLRVACLSDGRALDGMTGAVSLSCTIFEPQDGNLRKKNLQDDRSQAWALNSMLGKPGN